jgi:hypothetical protein
MALYAEVEGTNKELAMTLIRNCRVFVLCRIIKLKVLLERLSYIVTFLYIICNRETLRRNQFVSLNFAKPFPCIILIKGLVRS